jgi:RNA polymerase-associated protein LEO1
MVVKMQLNVVRLSNIMDIDVKPFDPNTYVAEEMFVTDDVTGRKQRLRLEGNVVRWRASHNDDGTTSVSASIFYRSLQDNTRPRREEHVTTFTRSV